MLKEKDDIFVHEIDLEDLALFFEEEGGVKGLHQRLIFIIPKRETRIGGLIGQEGRVPVNGDESSGDRIA
jgi:hypothetical protein